MQRPLTLRCNLFLGRVAAVISGDVFHESMSVVQMAIMAGRNKAKPGTRSTSEETMTL